jgi:hypothetical protein
MDCIRLYQGPNPSCHWHRNPGCLSASLYARDAIWRWRWDLLLASGLLNAVKVPPVVPRSAEARTTNSKQNGPSGRRAQIIGVESQILHRRCS